VGYGAGGECAVEVSGYAEACGGGGGVEGGVWACA